PGHSVHRMHAVPEKTGAALMGRLQNALQARAVPLLTQALVRELWLNAHDEVIGVGYLRPDGALEHLACDALILACNGFGGNADMVRQLLPEMRGAIYAGHSGNDGSAIAWGRALHARLADLGAYQGHGSWAVPQGALITWALMVEGAVQINALGQRFHDETLGYSEAAVQVLTQPGELVWNVFDEALLAFARGFPDFCAAEAAGAVKACADEHALAGLIGCDDAGLQATLASLDPGRIGPYGRVFTRALQAPFYAVQVTGALFHTQGGLDIDAQCRVLHADGAPFKNLLAAGGAARGVSGNAVWGYLSGNGLLSAIAGGFIAAQTTARLLEKKP
ncbi:MAG: FAD-binding protein, partial [Gammaproteobacteria bacterium]|nr:FAD-binding protein [Gammaproteobacteria bacterium]